MFFWLICWGKSGLPFLFLHHLRTVSLLLHLNSVLAFNLVSIPAIFINNTFFFLLYEYIFNFFLFQLKWLSINYLIFPKLMSSFKMNILGFLWITIFVSMIILWFMILHNLFHFVRLLFVTDALNQSQITSFPQLLISVNYLITVIRN